MSRVTPPVIGLTFFSLVLMLASVEVALTPPEEGSITGIDLSIYETSREGGAIGIQVRSAGDLPDGSALRTGWEAFIADQKGGWNVRLDTRSALPALAAGKGIPWVAGAGNDLSGPAPSIMALQDLARNFLSTNQELLGNWDGQLVLNQDASVTRAGRVWQISFKQVIDGVPVDGARYDFHVSHGNLVAFGASRWGTVRGNMTPAISAAEARMKLDEYLNLTGAEPFTDLEEPALHILSLDQAVDQGAAWKGVMGEGYRHVLVWRFTFADPNFDPTWVGEIDARTGDIVSFFNDTKYDRVHGNVHPIKDDGDCAGDGCPVPGYPMPFTDFSENGGADQYTGDFGLYECCTLGSTIETNLNGPYVWINDVCGSFSETISCDDELDLGVNDGINCDVAAGSSAGNTDAARSSFYNISRVNQKARYWMPGNSWLSSSLEIRTNVNSTCNATWGGRLNMYRAGNGCGNTGQLQGVVVHEWGHGMDENDGGGYDNPSEAYADVVAIFEARDSCVGPGFRPGQNCSGYGDTCLDCTGIRDMDWDARLNHTPATPSGFSTDNCSGGGGPCGKESHCASYVPSETIYDLAVRDLPASGLDDATSWQLAERLFYESRPGSGGDVYNCTLPDSDSCGTTSWYHQLRLQDDDDGNLSNGTPHAAAIFAAFDRHDIACGLSSDQENQSTSACPTLAAPVVTLTASTNTVTADWDPVTDASSYRVYRNEHGCDRSQVPLGEVAAPATSYVDDALANGVPVYYRVEAIGANSACTGMISACEISAAQPLAGKVKFSQAGYACGSTVQMRVTDSNHSSGTITVTIWSDTESIPETVLLTETSPGSSIYDGALTTTTEAPAVDGVLSITGGDTITAEYVDEDDGLGGTDVPVQSTALTDCLGPIISGVGEQNITDTSATIVWITNETADSELDWGESTPPTNHETGVANVTSHGITLNGLSECTIYHYQVQSTDAVANTVVDDNGGQFFHFETYGNFGSGLQPCHAGRVNLSAETYLCSDTVTFDLVDLDLNLDPLAIDTVMVAFSSTSEYESELVSATETDVNSAMFTGSITLATGTPVYDGVLQIADGDLVTGTYRDADDGLGTPAVSFDTAHIDCAGPKIQNLRITDISDQRMTVLFESPEPGDTVVEWGLTPSLGNVASDAGLTTDHAIVLNQLDTCQQVYLRASSTDAHGNTTVGDLAGSPHEAHTWEIPGLYYRETFESGAPDWVLTGEWQVGAPQGLGGSSGNADPSAAYNNTAVAGNDLTGLGSDAGDYQNFADETATTPVLNALSWTNTKLLVQRRLNVRSDDNATISILNKQKINGVYSSLGSTVAETVFGLQSYDVSAWVDGGRTIELEFKMDADSPAPYGDDGISSGWNIDDVILKDGAQPDFAACGGCGLSPSFNGAASAVDNDACGAGGVSVSWDQATAWGTGASGTYTIYRDTASGFTPSAGNMIASGVAAMSYIDNTAPDGQQLYYLVRAENNESCGAGPNNGGATDSNGSYVAVGTTNTQGNPTEVQPLQVDLVNYAHVRISWPAVSDAVAYRVYRSSSPDPATFVLLDETEGFSWEDQGEGGTANQFYYLIKGVNACGVEGI